MGKLSVYILAFNEEDKVAETIRSVQWADEVLLIDSGSTDRTAEIAQELGARVVNVAFEGFGKLRNSAIEHCSHEWILSMDSDERCTIEARDEIRRIMETPGSLDAYHVPRRNFFFGQWINHAGWYPDYRQPQLFRKGRMRYKEEHVHEGYELIGDARLGEMFNHIWQFPFKSLAEIMNKANRYSTLGADKLKAKGRTGGMWKALVHAGAAFLRHYVFKLGALDGWAGFIIAFNYFEYTFYKYAKLTAMEKGLNDPPPGPPPPRRG
jgi:glycosyltransferase involved in cell wall biosynthesis